MQSLGRPVGGRLPFVESPVLSVLNQLAIPVLFPKNPVIAVSVKLAGTKSPVDVGVDVGAVAETVVVAS